MSDNEFVATIPWGKKPVSNIANSDLEVEILLLQQNIIDDLVSNNHQPVVNNDINNVLIKKLSDLEIKLSTSNRDLIDSNEQLDVAIKQIHDLQISSLNNNAELESKISELMQELSISESLKQALLDSNHDLERKAANKAYQYQVLQSHFDVNHDAYNKIHKDHLALMGSHSVLVQTEKDNQKLIKQLTSEVDGFDLRLENVRKTERARILESLPPVVAQVPDTINSNDEVDALKQEVNELKEKLILCNSQKSEMNNAQMKANSDAERFKKEALRLVDHAHQSGELMDKAVAEMKIQTDIAARLDNAMQKTIVEFSKQTIKLDTIKRENAYMAIMQDYQEMRTVWSHEDGTSAYVISTNPSRALSLNDGEKERQSMIHPVCWVMNANGTGHIVLLNENQDELLFPSEAKDKCALNTDHKNALLAAIKNITIDKFDESLKSAVRRAQNICNAADVLDINWSEPLNIDRLLGKIMENELKEADILEARKAASVITRLAEMHRRGLNPKVKTHNSSSRNKKSRK